MVFALIHLFFGVLYPAFLTFTALEEEDEVSQKRWLQYWVCFAVLSTFQKFADFLISWIPFYSIGKIVLLYLMTSPRSSKTTEYIYDMIVSSFLRRHKDRINESLEMVLSRIHQTKTMISHHGLHLLRTKGREVMGSVNSQVASKVFENLVSPSTPAQPQGNDSYDQYDQYQ
ncbi:hypothetical protein GEMRC1_001699 [Eukaryota sp. GEM-RC1]